VAADPRLTFEDAASAWWDARAVRLRPTTQSAYGAALGHLRARFGRARLWDITPADVAAFVTAQQSASLKGCTIKGHLTVLSAVYKPAARHLGYVGGDVLKGEERRKIDRYTEDCSPLFSVSPRDVRTAGFYELVRNWRIAADLADVASIPTTS
jgi:hypothetical protein